MQPEVLMYLHILMIVGVLMSTPLIFKVFKLLGKLIVVKFWPVTSIELEIVEENGLVNTKTIKLSNTDELVTALLQHQKKEQI